MWLPACRTVLNSRSLKLAQGLGLGGDVIALFEALNKDPVRMAMLNAAITTVRLEKRENEILISSLANSCKAPRKVESKLRSNGVTAWVMGSPSEDSTSELAGLVGAWCPRINLPRCWENHGTRGQAIPP